MIFLGQQKKTNCQLLAVCQLPSTSQGLESQSTSGSRKGPVPKTSPWDVAVDSFVSPLTPHPGKFQELRNAAMLGILFRWLVKPKSEKNMDLCIPTKRQGGKRQGGSGRASIILLIILYIVHM